MSAGSGTAVMGPGDHKPATGGKSPFTDGFERDTKALLLMYDDSYKAISRKELRNNLRKLGVELDAEPGPNGGRIATLSVDRPEPLDPADVPYEDLTDEEIAAIIAAQEEAGVVD